MAQRTVLVCDKCGSDKDTFQFHMRAVGGTAPAYSGELCRSCYTALAKEAGVRKGTPRRGVRQVVRPVDYDTGEPL